MIVLCGNGHVLLSEDNVDKVEKKAAQDWKKEIKNGKMRIK